VYGSLVGGVVQGTLVLLTVLVGGWQIKRSRLKARLAGEN